MSPSMILGRVILPAIGLALAGVLVWQVVRTGSLELSGTPASGPLRWLQAGLQGSSTASREEAKPLANVQPQTRTAPKISAEGRVVAYPGAEVVVGAETPGTIVAVRVREKAVVRAGELLVEFKADELRASLDEAAARVTEAEAELDFQQKEVALMERLIECKAGSDEERERIRSRLIVARAAIRGGRDVQAARSGARENPDHRADRGHRHVAPGSSRRDGQRRNAAGQDRRSEEATDRG